jgi:predicted nucleotide-binding protein
MPLPVRTDLADIEAICGYLIARPAGASAAEIAADLGGEASDRGKLHALEFWGLLEATGGKLHLSERGLLAVREDGAHRAAALGEVVAAIAPYSAVIVRAVERNARTIMATEVATLWHRHFRATAHFGILNHQTVCFFRVAEGAGLGRLVVGRKGGQTRFELAETNARAFVEAASFATAPATTDSAGDRTSGGMADASHRFRSPAANAGRRGSRVFISHRSNKTILNQVKELVAFGKFEPVVAQDCEAPARLVLHDLMDEMRGCDTAVIAIGAEGLPLDGHHRRRVGGDVLIEIGAAMALYGRNFVLLVEEGIELPSVLHGLCVCRYGGSELDMAATMKLFKAFNDFARAPPARPLALSVGPDHVIPHLIRYEQSGHAAQR